MQETKQPSKFMSLMSSFSKKMSQLVRLESNRSLARKVASSLWALLFGVLISLIYMVFKGQLNPFVDSISVSDILKKIGESFNVSNADNFKFYFIIFGFAGLASAIGFKAGLFNIGISGQMMMAGLSSMAIFISLNFDSTKTLPAGWLAFTLLLSIVLSFIIASIAGALKAYLNVHEVISTIMLNWIVVGLASLFFKKRAVGAIFISKGRTETFFADDENGTKSLGIIDDKVKLGFVIGGIIALILLVTIITIIFNFTTLGYKIKMQGISKTNGKYMGVNDKLTTVIVMGVSGALAGVAGFYWYVLKETAPVFGSVDTPLALGFESIAISLLALNAPVGILFTSLFYTIIYSSKLYLTRGPLYLSEDDVSVATALILYLAAISQLFMTFKPYKFTKRAFATMVHSEFIPTMKIHMLESKKARSIASYSMAVHNIKMKIDQNNETQLLNSLMAKNQKHAMNLHKIEVLKKFWLEKLELAKEVQKQRQVLVDYKKAIKLENKSAETKDLQKIEMQKQQVAVYKTQIKDAKTVYKNLKLDKETAFKFDYVDNFDYSIFKNKPESHNSLIKKNEIRTKKHVKWIFRKSYEL
ncbi:ABC transporter permease [Mycoplasma struthionis]|uniref:ABC transporter permease n=1 Tax=Mycoplasma struthionis TaxID=538220 RepID=A0A502M6M8_9MOLU|nr:ABC transporter permease [Mycoplasma struthionis]TPI02520.1 ABC transporter permease [Mycoplasma struthionis]